MVEKYEFVKNVKKFEWSALPKDFEAGEVIYGYIGYDYGLSRDDFLMMGAETTSCTLDKNGGVPFFTVPKEFIRRL